MQSCLFYREVLLKARNPYMSRRLPYIIGTEDFTKYDHLGLVTSSEDEEEEEVEEKFEPSEAEDANVMAKIPPQSIADNIKVRKPYVKNYDLCFSLNIYICPLSTGYTYIKFGK